MVSAAQVILNTDKHVQIAGVPGAGKTTFATELAQYVAREDVLYLSFGRENTLGARARLGKNVTCMNFHVFAKKEMNIQSNRIIPSFTMDHLRKTLKKMAEPAINLKMLEAIVTLNALYCNSAHTFKSIHYLFNVKNMFPAMPRDEQAQVIATYIRYWKALWIEGCRYGVTHDMYLKAFATKGLLISYTRIIIDEAQDLNECMFQLLDRLSADNPKTQLIYLGDPCQQIFGFRGVSERFVEEQFNFSLNRTHRFGRDVCRLLNRFMGSQNISYYTPMTSRKNDTTIATALSFNNIVAMAKSGKRITYISRLNITLWHLLKHLAEHDIKFAILGGLQQSEVNFLKSLHDFYITGRSTHPQLRRRRYDDYKQQLKMNNERPAYMACKFIETITGDANAIFDKIAKSFTDQKSAQVLLSTVHQAKGLQFNHLTLAHDFHACVDEKTGQPIVMPREECHLLYTAITRVKKSLYLPNGLYQYWKNLP